MLFLSQRFRGSRPGTLLKAFAGTLLLCALALPCLAAAPANKNLPQEPRPWTFGQSSDRHNPLWRKSNDGDEIIRKTKPKMAVKNSGAVDTTASIGRALDAAADRAIEAKRKLSTSGESAKPAHKPRGSVGMSMADESSAWKVAPGEIRVDEYVPRNRKHVVRAFADVKASNDLDIRVGPELHVRDDSIGAESAYEKEPDSTLGVGMHFKLDF